MLIFLYSVSRVILYIKDTTALVSCVRSVPELSGSHSNMKTYMFKINKISFEISNVHNFHLSIIIKAISISTMSIR